MTAIYDILHRQNRVVQFMERVEHPPQLGLVPHPADQRRPRRFSFGPVAGVLFAGLFLGHFDFRMSPGAQSVGFALFIFSVGYQAGPRFSSLRVAYCGMHAPKTTNPTFAVNSI